LRSFLNLAHISGSPFRRAPHYLYGSFLNDIDGFGLQSSGRIGNLLSVKWWHYLILGGIVSVCVGYVWMHREELGLTHQHAIGDDDSRDLPSTGPVAHPATISWQKVDRSADGFRVEMPTDVKQIQIPAYNGTGGAEQLNMIFSNPSSDTTFSVVWQDNPPVGSGGRKPDHILEDARDGAVARTQTTLVNDAATNTQGFPGRTFEARNSGGGIMNSRLVYAGSRLYMLTAAFPSASARRPKDVSRFFNSFTITASAGAKKAG
jgi:hypothetical protein